MVTWSGLGGAGGEGGGGRGGRGGAGGGDKTASGGGDCSQPGTVGGTDWGRGEGKSSKRAGEAYIYELGVQHCRRVLHFDHSPLQKAPQSPHMCCIGAWQGERGALRTLPWLQTAIAAAATGSNLGAVQLSPAYTRQAPQTPTVPAGPSLFRRPGRDRARQRHTCRGPAEAGKRGKRCRPRGSRQAGAGPQGAASTQRLPARQVGAAGWLVADPATQGSPAP
jgi:hypothetical protein